MQRYKLSHVWNEEPDYEAMARSMLDLLLELESEGRLDEVLGTCDAEERPPTEGGEAA